jgi:hypothetical protein
MRILLRDLGSGLYAGKSGAWGALDAAEDFSTMDEAGRKAGEIEGDDLAVVLSYENPTCELVVNPSYCGGCAGTAPDPLFWFVA